MPFSESRGRDRFASPDLHLRLVEQYAPPSIVVNDEHEIVHVSDNAAMYLQFSGGEPSNNLLKVVRPELRLELRTALYQAAQRHTNVDARHITVSIEGRAVTVNLLIRPVLRDDDPARGFFLVLFDQTEPGETSPDQPSAEIAADPAGQLEDEVVRLKSQLRATVERYETQAEELKASNEEGQAVNEELRSASEELETSREELQSLNEELRTVNQQLKVKVDEQTQTSNDLTNLINSTDIGTIFLDRTGRIKLFTPRTRELFNLIPSDRGRPLADISHHFTGPDLQADIERVLDRLERLEREVESRDGRWYLLRIGPYRTADDRIEGVVLTFVDVTDRKRASELVRVSEERLRRSFEIDTVGILFFQPNGRITDTNDAFLRMSGYAREDMSSGRLHWDTLALTGRSAELAEGLRQFVTLGRLLPREVEHVRPDGERWWGLYAATRLDEQEGVAFVVDVTERRQAEASLRDADRRKNEFLATLAHELRNPLAPITTAAQILRLKDVPEPLVDKAHQTIERQVGQMVRLVDDLLELSRITHGKIEFRRQRVLLSDVVDTAVESATPLIDQARHRLSVNMPPEPLFVYADPMRMAQIFANLLHNAAKYTPEGGEITFAVTTAGGEIRISVRDNGVGIPTEVLPHVFDIFTQGHHLPAGHEQTGLGIGLTLVRTLVEAHGGRVDARSDGPGKGSEFLVYLPLAGDEAVEPPLSTTTEPEDLGGKRVLVVDDNRDAASTLVTLLSLLGADATVAFDGAAGLSAAAKQGSDIVFLDLGMPGMDGFEVARKIRSGPRGDDVTLVAVTGRDQPQDREAALAAGFDAYLTKPATSEQIRAACRRQSRSRSED
jgi:two-component system CheB/CheR fusion protein